MERGYIKLWRKIMDSEIFANPALFKLWALCLMKATHEDIYISINGVVKSIKLSPGQFVTGRYALHKEYYPRKATAIMKSPLTLWRWLKILENMQILTIKSCNKFSIISIINWNQYQQNEQQMNNRRTTDEQQMNTNKNNKNNKNNKKRVIPDIFLLTQQLKKYALGKGIFENEVNEIFEHFKNHHAAKGSLFANWDRAWFLWVRNELKFNTDKYKPKDDYDPVKCQAPLEEVLS